MRKIIPVVAAGATALAVAGTTFGYASLDKAVTLSLDGQTTQVSTTAGTVGALLESKGIEVNSHDVVAPSADDQGRRRHAGCGPVRPPGDLHRRRRNRRPSGPPRPRSTRRSTHSSIDLAGAELSTSRSSASAGRAWPSPSPRQKKIIIVDAGKKRAITTTGQTVADALAAAKITVDNNDKLSASPTARLVDGTKFTLHPGRCELQDQEDQGRLQHRAQGVEQAEHGVTKVDTAGVSGVRTVTYEIVRHNGKIVKRSRSSPD